MTDSFTIDSLPYARQQDWADLEPQIDRLEAGAAWARGMAYQAEHTRALPVLPLPDPNKSRVVEHRRERSTSDAEPQSGAKLFTNPASDHTFIVLDQVNEDGINYRLFDGAGRVVAAERVITAGQVFQIELSGLAPGIYACELSTTDGLTETLQLVVKN